MRVVWKNEKKRSLECSWLLIWRKKLDKRFVFGFDCSDREIMGFYNLSPRFDFNDHSCNDMYPMVETPRILSFTSVFYLRFSVMRSVKFVVRIGNFIERGETIVFICT